MSAYNAFLLGLPCGAALAMLYVVIRNRLELRAALRRVDATYFGPETVEAARKRA